MFDVCGWLCLFCCLCLKSVIEVCVCCLVVMVFGVEVLWLCVFLLLLCACRCLSCCLCLRFVFEVCVCVFVMLFVRVVLCVWLLDFDWFFCCV